MDRIVEVDGGCYDFVGTQMAFKHAHQLCTHNLVEREFPGYKQLVRLDDDDNVDILNKIMKSEYTCLLFFFLGCKEMVSLDDEESVDILNKLIRSEYTSCILSFSELKNNSFVLMMMTTFIFSTRSWLVSKIKFTLHSQLKES